jgi:hypothetical protein
MVCRLIAVAIDCHVELVSAFWACALGQDFGHRWQDVHGAVYVELDGGPPAFGRPVLLFQQVTEARSTKNRVHIDVVVPAGDAAAQEVARLVELGAGVLDDDDDLPWTVLADPEGNEFCVRSGPRHEPLPPGRPDRPVTARERRPAPPLSTSGSSRRLRVDPAQPVPASTVPPAPRRSTSRAGDEVLTRPIVPASTSATSDPDHVDGAEDHQGARSKG